MDRARILSLVPHQGAMCLLDGVRAWDATSISCVSRSHLDPGNPLRRDGRLSAVCGCEYGFQAAAVHGALVAGGVPPPQGWIAALRVDHIGATRLDDPAIGTLGVEATLRMADAGGLIYGFRLVAEDGRALVEGRGTIALPRGAGPA